MKKILVIMMLSLFNMQISAFASVKIPENTEITLIPVETITSRTAGKQLKLKIKEDVLIDNSVIFKKDSKAFLKIVDTELASQMGVPGSIEICNGYVYDTKGNKHEVAIDKKIYGKEQVWAQILFSLGFTIILCPLFLFGFVKGTNAKISPENELEVMLKEEFVF